MEPDHNSDKYRLLWLAALEDAGVDNWEGFDAALELYNDYIKDEEAE